MEKYNGWTNYQTWATYLHLSEDIEIWSNNYAEDYEGEQSEFIAELAAYLEETFYLNIVEPTNLCGVMSDLSGHSLIDWAEIAEHCEDAIEFVRVREFVATIDTEEEAE